MSPKDLLLHITDSVKELISLKRTVQALHEYSFDHNDSYQLQLQKLEDEVRSHVKLELQMKVYVDSLQDKLDAAQAQFALHKQNYERTLQRLELENKGLLENQRQASPLRLKKDFERFLGISRKNQQLESELAKAKTELTDRELELQSLRRQNTEFSYKQKPEGTAEFFKKKYDHVVQDCLRTKQAINRILNRLHSTSKSKSPLTARPQKSTSPVIRAVLKNPYKLPVRHKHN